jgi:hypothetical protein
VFTNQQIQQLGQQFFASVPSPQNATALALVIYDWTMPGNAIVFLLCF